VFTPADPEYTWMAAKMWFNFAETADHESASHLGLYLRFYIFWQLLLTCENNYNCLCLDCHSNCGLCVEVFMILFFPLFVLKKDSFYSHRSHSPANRVCCRLHSQGVVSLSSHVQTASSSLSLCHAYQ